MTPQASLAFVHASRGRYLERGYPMNFIVRLEEHALWVNDPLLGERFIWQAGDPLDLRDLYLPQADLGSADLEEGRLDRADLRDAILPRVLPAAPLAGTMLNASQMVDCDLDDFKGALIFNPDGSKTFLNEGLRFAPTALSAPKRQR